MTWLRALLSGLAIRPPASTITAPPGIGGGGAACFVRRGPAVAPSPRDKDGDRAGRKIDSESTTSGVKVSSAAPRGTGVVEVTRFWRA
jgi:hypothetical protein